MRAGRSRKGSGRGRGAENEVCMTGLSSVAAVTCTAAFVFGMLLALLGGLKLKLAERLQIDEARVGGLLAALNLALIPMMLVSGVLIDRFGVRAALSGGALVAAVAVFSLSLRRTYAAALVCVLALGAGAACISTASVVLMPTAFGFARGELVASLNLGHVFVALGALMTPTLADLLLRTLDFRKASAVLALVCLVPAAVAALYPLEAGVAEKGGLVGVFDNLPILLAGVAFLFYAPLEFAVSTWGTTYLTVDKGYREGPAAWVMSFFWLAFLVGRVLVTLLFRYFQWRDTGAAPLLIFVLSLAAAAIMGNLAGSGKPRSATWGLVALGLTLGPIFPTLVAVALHAAPENSRGTAYGVMFALGSLGSAALAPVLGLLARRKTVLRALRLLAPVALLLVVAALAMVVVR
jgi:fucose permease